MSQSVITRAFVEWKAQQAIDNQPVVLDEFVFANVPELDVTLPIPDTDGLPDNSRIVHRQAVSKAGTVNFNAVVYSVTLGAEVGDFDFNWIGLLNKASGTVAAIIHAPEQRKIKNSEGQQGNVLTRSILMEFNNAQEETEISVPAETWQIDFTARLAGMDERQRIENVDIYGAAAFFGDGFLVTRSGTKYNVAAGAGYVGGLRAVLDEAKSLAAPDKPCKVWVDVVWTGSLLSVWGVQTLITVNDTFADYVADGRPHYVFAVAAIDAAGAVTDLRPKGSLADQSGATAYARKDKNLSDLDSIPKARETLELKGAALLNVGRTAGTVAAGDDSRIVDAVPNTRKVNGHLLNGDITITVQDIFNGQAVLIGNAQNLNDYQVPGLYYQPANAQASAGANYPEGVAGSLEVLKHAGITQIYRLYNSSRHWMRTLYGGAWTAWAKAYDSVNKPTLAEIGALAVGGTAVAAAKLATARTIAGVAFDGQSNITIPAGNVGAYTKAEVNNLVNARGTKSTASIGVNGWFRDGDTGFIMQWGQVAAGTGNVAITFPIPFPNACRNMSNTVIGGGGERNLSTVAAVPSRTGATIGRDNNGAFWQAWGY